MHAIPGHLATRPALHTRGHEHGVAAGDLRKLLCHRQRQRGEELLETATTAIVSAAVAVAAVGAVVANALLLILCRHRLDAVAASAAAIPGHLVTLPPTP